MDGFHSAHEHVPTHFSTSPDDSMITLATPTPVAIVDLNVTRGSGGLSQSAIGMQGMQPRTIPIENLPDARNLFDGTPYPMSARYNLDFNDFMENIIYKGRGQAFHPKGDGQAFDPDETRS
ncbi:hypothetical protein D1007_19984 [Hordeum vulgare]|nr:hypothetical protein D1007_19984 [Hordeum vulgare]